MNVMFATMNSLSPLKSLVLFVLPVLSLDPAFWYVKNIYFECQMLHLKICGVEVTLLLFVDSLPYSPKGNRSAESNYGLH